MAKIAILKSQHLEVARLFEESLDEVLCMAGNPNAEDLLKVTDFTSKEYWCDEIEFINNIPEQKEVVINNVDKLVAEYCDSLLPHVNALCHKSILEIATWSYRQGVEEMIEKQGEQKHDDKVKPKFKVGDTIRPKGSLAEYTIESIYGERYHGKGWGLDISCDNDYELVKQESAWGEEDEKMMNSFLHKVEVCYLLTNKENVWIINKLKSLKQRCTWKPSDEQMEALWNTLHPDDPYYVDLSSLYNELKKLKGE